MINDPFAFSVEQVQNDLQSDLDTGLTSTEAKRRLSVYGNNALQTKSRKKTWLIFLQQFLDPIIYILTGAMALAFAFNEIIEGFAILAVLIITALIGFIMELQAIRSVEALQKITKKISKVIRGGKEIRIKTSGLVPGDIILLGPGDIVPADARLAWNQRLTVNESILTGESIDVLKNQNTLKPGIPVTDQLNMVFKGTTVVHGNARAIVTGTGMQTVLGKISQLTQEATHSRSPLEKKLARLSHRLIVLTLVVIAVIAGSAFLQGRDLLLMAKTAVALAVAAIPEGLPIVATIALARGMIRLSRKNVVIKQLDAVQTLGETTIVCTDKTGTLTMNKMAVRILVFHNQLVENDHKNLKINHSSVSKPLNRFNQVAILCNNLNPGENDLHGDSIEMALLEYVQAQDIDIEPVRKEFKELDEVPFDPVSKIMMTANKSGQGVLICVKGALEVVLDRCSHVLTENGIVPLKDRQKWLYRADEIAAEGLRILGFAYQEIPDFRSWDDIGDDLVFIGFAGFMDAPRTDVKQAIQTYKEAGIKVVMITGDHPNTARKIAEEVGLIDRDASPDTIVHGQSLSIDEKKDSEEHRVILNARIFARMIPEQKLDLITFYQANQEVVGMIGDGVNDAPALKKADIGIAMGIRGTEAAKEVSDVVLLDDKFTSTETAIRQGRSIFQNIRNFVVFLLSCNLAEIISVAVSTLSNLPMPLLPLQILFLNLVTDVFPALALGLGKGEPGIMKEPPRDPKEPIVTGKLWKSTIVYGLCITAAVLGITVYGHYIREYSAMVINNMAFYTLVLGQLLNVFNLPGRKVSFFNNEVTRNGYVWGALILSILIMIVANVSPLLKQVLSLVQLDSEQLLVVLLFGLFALLITQLLKRLFRVTV